MTETSAANAALPPALERFVVHWGEMGTAWGVNRSVAQIHALLYVADEPLAAEDIAGQLGMARSNVSTSLRELVGWSLVRRVHAMGDRRDYYEAEADMFEMVRRIALGRKAREIDPALAVLRACVAEAKSDPCVSAAARRRLSAMLGFTETVDKSFNEIMALPAPTLMTLLRMGGAVARLAARGKRARSA
ncbi:MAG TPA: MarR family transcriptional regulator [Hyphomicrobium sp.]|jgi:DNA-binding transcriptional regulator GbsR (MarR family)